jgi:hypothetical protein
MTQPRTFRTKRLIILPLVNGGIPLQSLSPPNNMQQPHLANADLACAVTRSGKVIHHPTEQPVDTQPRCVKRRRTDASTFEATAVQTEEVSDIPFDDEPAALSALQVHNTAINDLQARTATSAGTSSIHGNGTNFLHLSIGAKQMYCYVPCFEQAKEEMLDHNLQN